MSSTMKQSMLSFGSVKRTNSNSIVGKPTAKTDVPAVRKVSTSTASDIEDFKTEDGSNYDDINLPEDSDDDSDDDEIQEVPPPEEEKRAATTSETPARQTRSKAKNASTAKASTSKKAKETEVEEPTISTVFKSSNTPTNTRAKKVEGNENSQSEPAELDVKSRKYNRLYADARDKRGGLEIVHGEKNKVLEILRVFDNSYEFGPCVGMTRLERWERAEKLGLNPPVEIHEILISKQGLEDAEYKHTVFLKEV